MTTKIETYKGFKVHPLIMEVEEETFRSFFIMQNYECALSDCHSDCVTECRECLFYPGNPKTVKAYKQWYKEHEESEKENQK